METVSGNAAQLVGTRVRLLYEPASDPVDRYGRLLRYVVRVQRRDERQPAPRRRRRGSPVVLRGRARPLLREAPGAREAGKGETARPVGCLPANGIRPVQRGHDATVTHDPEEPRCANCGRKPRSDEIPDDEWRVESDGAGELVVSARSAGSVAARCSVARVRAYVPAARDPLLPVHDSRRCTGGDLLPGPG